MDYVFALGGSIICPKKIDTEFLRGFYNLITERIEKNDRFVIITGGGDVARHYQKSASLVNGVSDEQKDWIGIHATYLNAHLLKSIFNRFCHPEIVNRKGKVKRFGDSSLIIGSGWKPGWSTDYVATKMAIDTGIDNILILSKQDYVYNKDPDENKDAQPIREISWSDYRSIIPKDWQPGLNVPVDPIASKLADERNKKVIVANGKDLDNLKLILDGSDFKGTTIK